MRFHGKKEIEVHNTRDHYALGAYIEAYGIRPYGKHQSVAQTDAQFGGRNQTVAQTDG